MLLWITIWHWMVLVPVKTLFYSVAMKFSGSNRNVGLVQSDTPYVVVHWVTRSLRVIVNRLEILSMTDSLERMSKLSIVDIEISLTNASGLLTTTSPVAPSPDNQQDLRFNASRTLACCTCHVILSPEHFERVDQINPAGEEELDLLDLAPELSDYSRLGCQVQVESNDPETIVVKVPTQKRDARTLD
uniref:2Fe-2S ferredoxin-type domain-containing protein n=1 Tax=Angiostrongylus cantonensis TaxID=6313 RepID=A0A0K0D2X3_ANGCA